MSILDSISTILKPIFGFVDDLVTSDEEKGQIRNKIYEVQSHINMKVLEYESKLIEMQADVLKAEITGKNWMQSNWRPALMVVFIAVIVNNYIIFPYLSMLTDHVVMLSLPPDLWTLMEIGVGGYIVGRSGEKIVPKLVEKKL